MHYIEAIILQLVYLAEAYFQGELHALRINVSQILAALRDLDKAVNERYDGNAFVHLDFGLHL